MSLCIGGSIWYKILHQVVKYNIYTNLLWYVCLYFYWDFFLFLVVKLCVQSLLFLLKRLRSWLQFNKVCRQIYMNLAATTFYTFSLISKYNHTYPSLPLEEEKITVSENTNIYLELEIYFQMHNNRRPIKKLIQ